MNTILKSRWGENSTIIGTWVKTPSIFILESTIQAGFDFIVVDMEHSYMPEEWLYTAVAVAQAHGVAVIVRVPESSGCGLSRILDLGLDGVLFPQIYNLHDAQQAISATRFQPQGSRGVGVTSRAGKWATIPQGEYMERAESELFRIIQFEIKSAFDDLDAILNIEGLSATFLGPSDLSQALGVAMDDPIISELGRTLAAKSKERGIPCGTALGNPDQIEKAIEIGYSFVMVSNDTSIYNNSVRKLFVDSHAKRALKGGDRP